MPRLVSAAGCVRLRAGRIGASATAPRMGDVQAMKMPAAAVAKPHSDWPRAASPTTVEAKYGA